MDNAWLAFSLGGSFGIFNGFLCRFLLKRSLEKSDRYFMLSFLGCLFYKLIFLIASILILDFKKSTILIIYSFTLVFFQLIFGLKPLKK